jgi:molybdopterin-containing oxidoreductase family membrane subunit
VSRKILAVIGRSTEPAISVFEEMERSPGFYMWIGFLVVLIFLGGYALLISLIHGMEILEFYTNIPWEMMVSNYVFLVGSSVGLCLIASLGYVFGLKRYEPVAKRALFLALITIICGLASISLHLGHPERSAIYGALTPNLRSAMAYMGVLYPPYIALIAFWYWLLAREGLRKRAALSEGLQAKAYRIMALEGLRPYLHQRFPLREWEAKMCRVLPLERMGLSLDSEGVEVRWARIIGPLALVFALLAFTVEGSLFAHVEARPFWYGALIPIDFLLGATFCGLSWIMATEIITYKVKGEEMPPSLKELFHEMAGILALLLSLGLLFTTYKMGHGLFEPGKAETIMLFLNGPFSQAFWVLEIGVGIVFPVFILVYAAWQRKIGGVLVGSVMVLVGYFVKRYDFVVASQVFPLIKQQHPLSSHFPTFMEMLLIGGIIGALLLAYTLGETFLPLKEEGPIPDAITK